MFAIPWAITRAYWRRAGWWNVGAMATLVVPALGLWLFSLTPIGRALEQIRISRFLHLPLFVGFLIQLVAMVVQVLGPPRRNFILPIGTERLVGWTLANTTVAGAAAYLLPAAGLNVLIDADWPLAGPTAVVLAATACAVAIGWGLASSQGLQGLAWLVAVGLIGRWVVERTQVYEAPELTTRWPPLSVADVAYLIAATFASYVLAVAGLKRERCGAGWTAPTHWLRRWQDREIADAQPAFRSPGAAQRWFEWRTRGWLPIVPTLALVLVSLIAVSFVRAQDEWTIAFLAPFYLTLCSPVVGLFLGGRSADFRFSTYDATRPLSNDDLSRAVLANVVRSGAWAYLVAAIGSALAVGVLFLRGEGDVLLSRMRDWRSGVMLPSILAVLLSSWTGMALGATMGFTRKSLFTTIALLGTAVLCSGIFVWGFLVPDSLRPIIGRTLLQAIGGLCLLTMIVVQFLAHRRGHVSGRRLAGQAAAWLLLVGAAAGLWLTWQRPEPAILLVFGPGLLTLPFLPLAAMPLACAWNRHQ